MYGVEVWRKRPRGSSDPPEPPMCMFLSGGQSNLGSNKQLSPEVLALLAKRPTAPGGRW